MESLEGDLVVDGNLRLAWPGGLGALRVVNGALQITDNPRLRSAEIASLVDGLNGQSSGGQTVSGNAP